MKKNRFFIYFLLSSFLYIQVYSQTLDQPANWPNPNWTFNVITHTGTNPQDIEANPVIDDSFAYDDAQTGIQSHDIVAVESPVVDLTPAYSAGEYFLKIFGQYVFIHFSDNEYLAFEYWDADANIWKLFYQFDNDNTPGSPYFDYCSGIHVDYKTTALDISSFTATQLAGFKYRLIYNDDISGNEALTWGFCFSSPTIKSSSVNYQDISVSYDISPDCNQQQFFLEVSVDDLGGAASVTVSDNQSHPVQQVFAPDIVTFGPYPEGTSVIITVVNDQEPFYNVISNPVSYHCPPPNDDCDQAVEVPVNPDETCLNTVHGVTAYATASSQPDDAVGAPNNDVWFKFTATQTRHIISILNTTAAGSHMYMAIYDGSNSCNNLSLVEDYEGDSFVASGLVPGRLYFLRVYGYPYLQTGQEFDVCVSTPPPPPANDDCDQAVTLQVNPGLGGTAIVHGTTLNATPSPNAGNLPGTPNNDVWYKFTATHTGHDIILSHTVNTSGNNTSMAMAVYDGLNGCSSLTLIGTHIVGYSTYYVNNMIPGHTYYVRVYGWNSYETGQEFDISVGTLPPPPLNDDCDQAIDVPVNPDLSCSASVHGSTLYATESSQIDDVPYDPDNDVWFKFTATGTGHRLFLNNVSVNAQHIRMAVYDGAGGCNGLIYVAVNDFDTNELTLRNLISGRVYYVRVYSASPYGYGESFDLCIGTLPPSPSNDDCDNAQVLPVNTDVDCSNSVQGTTAFSTASSQVDDVPGTPNNDVWYVFTATQTREIIKLSNVIAVDGSNLVDLVLAVYDGQNSCSGLSLIATGSIPTHTLFLDNLSIGNDYFIRVYSWSSQISAQNFDICVASLPQPPANDTCMNATGLTLSESQSCTNSINVSNAGSTDSGIPAPSCGFYSASNVNGDIWFSLQIPNNMTSIWLDVSNESGLSSVVGAIYRGDCHNLTEVTCNDYYSGWPWNVSALIPGETYYLRLWDYLNDELGTFDLCGYYTTSAIADHQIPGFKYYPNPVNHMLNLSAKDSIEMISISNVTGQEVLNVKPNTTQTQVDMSHLKNGIYFVKAQVNGQLTAFKVVKK